MPIIDKTKPRRLRFIEDLLIKQWSVTRIVDAVVGEFGIAERQAYIDLKAARMQWHEEAMAQEPQKRELRRLEMRATMKAIVARAIEVNDLKAALRGCQLLSTFDGLNEPTQVVVQEATDPYSKWGERTREELLSFVKTARLPAGASN